MPVSFWLSDCKIGNQSIRYTVGSTTTTKAAAADATATTTFSVFNVNATYY